MRKIESKKTLMQSGFTLIELVIVIVIIGILAAVAIPQFGDIAGTAETNSGNYQSAATSTVNAVSTIMNR